MKRLHIKTQFGSCILYFALYIFLLLLSGCGSGTSDETSSDTGSIAFSVVFRGAPSGSEVRQAQSPSGDVCVDYAIDTISGDVYNSANNVVASGSWPCSDHSGTFKDVATGTVSIMLEGTTVSGAVDWRGEKTGISVSAGGTTDAGTVTTYYIGDDTTPPNVESTNPADGATDVPINTAITATFSEAVVSASVSTSTFTLKSDTTPVSGTVTCDSSSRTAIFTPDSDLSASTTYTATITTDVEDMAANHMAANYTWSFTTGSALDITPPTVSSTYPPNGETDVAVNTAITATFSEAMDPSTINTASFFVNDGSTNIADQVAYSGTTATFMPTAALTYNTTYTVTITTGAKDLAGNALQADYPWSFTTTPGITWYKDTDGDGYSDGTTQTSTSRPSGEYYLESELTATSGDCNDNDPNVNPGATEVCNNGDDNCDGNVDEGVKSTFYRDADVDGYGDPDNPTEACAAPSGYVDNNTDCDDDDGAVNPGATEVCDDGLDNDCDGLTDFDDSDCMGNNANLSNLTVSEGSLAPLFNPDIIFYSERFESTSSITSITATPTAADANAGITVNGTPVTSGTPSDSIPINVGSNIITILVTAENGTTTKTYTINACKSAIDLPQTGQTTSYASGDDGDLQMGVAGLPPRFTDNSDGTITDNLTGLMWEQTPDTTDRDFYQALTYANDLAVADHSDWHLPNIWELITIFNIGVSDQRAWLNSQNFSIAEGCYRSSTTAAYDDSGVWDIHLQATWLYGWHNKTTLPVTAWAVRSAHEGAVLLPQTGQTTSSAAGDDGDLQKGVTWPHPRFTNNGNGTITDNLTGLMWEQAPSTTAMLWVDALDYATTLDLGGYTDWRLPNVYELATLQNAEESRTCAWLTAHGFTNVQEEWNPSYWSSTTFNQDTGRAFAVSLGYGGISTTSKVSGTSAGYTMAVRSGDIQSKLIYLFNEDFEDGDVSDWTDWGDHTVEVTSSTGANGTSYSLSISGSGTTGIYYQLNDITPTSITFYAKASETDKDAGILYLNGGGHERISFRFAGAGYVTINGAVTDYYYSANEWTLIEIKNINWSASPPTFDFFVEGSSVKVGKTFMNWDYNPVLIFDRIRIRNYDSTQVWFDEIIMGADEFYDSDGDGMRDGWEVANGLNPSVNDAEGDLDGDDLNNLGEYQHDTDPNNSDTDEDGMPDGWEVTYGLEPTEDDALGDLDGDEYTNVQEYSSGTNPNDGTSMPQGPIADWYVDAAVADSGNGGSWGRAFKTIYEAIHEATESDEIWVRQGTYNPHPADSILVYKAVAIYGGFAGDEIQRNQRDWQTNVTTVDGQNNRRCFWMQDDATIDGFTIKNGTAAEDGAGMNIEECSPTIANCTFSGNIANGLGGGIYIDNQSEATITFCTFSRNSADEEGGGIYNYHSHPDIYWCTFTENRAGVSGGAIYDRGSTPAISRCTFTLNTAGYMGGAIFNDSSSPPIMNCSFIRNSTDDQSGSDMGGAMHNVDWSEPEIANCLFYANSAARGAAISNQGNSSPPITNCTFHSNTATLYGGGVYYEDSSSPIITNSILWGDSALSDPEIALGTGSTPEVTYSDIGQPGYASNNNISEDPVFVVPPLYVGDFRLQEGSNCIDAGNSAAIPLDIADVDRDGDTLEQVPMDIEGRPRRMSMVVPWPNDVDMGAFEY